MRAVAVKSNNPTVVIGAGPYGLSIAAYLQDQGIPALVFGKPMKSWHNMPTGMYLKSVWSASTFFDPAGKYSLNRYIASTNTARQEPIPYRARQVMDKRAVRPAGAQWLQHRVEGHVRLTADTQIARAMVQGRVLRLELSDGTTREVDHLFLGTGYQPNIDKLALTGLYRKGRKTHESSKMIPSSRGGDAG